MSDKQVIDEVRPSLTQIALELEEAAAGAKAAAGCLHDHDAAWARVQHLFARLDQANHLINGLKHENEDATKRGVRR